MRTHNLEELIKDAERFDPAFQNQLYAATTLNPFATRFRYPVPSGPDLPQEIDTFAALTFATDVVAFVRERLFPPPPEPELS
jgi:hypothetical protein